MAIAMTLGVSVGASCATAPPDVPSQGSGREIALGQEFPLRTGESVRIAGTDLRVTFDRVTEDSRCPINVNCVWAGNAVVRLAARIADASRGPLELHSTTADKRDAAVDGYRIQLVRLAPARTEGTPIPQDQYIATLAVVRSR